MRHDTLSPSLVTPGVKHEAPIGTAFMSQNQEADFPSVVSMRSVCHCTESQGSILGYRHMFMTSAFL
jgi:hypothetical protein